MKFIFTFLFSSLAIFSVKSAVWETVKSGPWNNNSTWLGGVSPSFTNLDTILVKHYLYLGSDVVLNSGAFLKIDSSGGLCGHQTITVSTGARILKYGTLELDTLLVPGGIVNLYVPGDVILTNYGKISKGGSLNSNCGLAVGPWFDCRKPFHNAVEDELTIGTISLFPNPSTGVFTISGATQQSTFYLFDVEGKIVFQKLLPSSTETIDLSKHATGIYFWKIIGKDYIEQKRGKLQVLR